MTTWLGINWLAVLVVGGGIGFVTAWYRRGARQRAPLFPEFDAWCREQTSFDSTLADIHRLPETTERVA